ncbi:hypothetical protein KEM56_001118 [Ascosphaera pollenicola]|nr:hypothetical protein KEM56_001118 [Ascosphaera pollenicola]
MDNVPPELDDIFLEDESPQNLSALSEQDSTSAATSVNGAGGKQAVNNNPVDAPAHPDRSLSPATPIENEEDELQAANSWPSSKTKSGKARKRLPCACLVCRRKKIKCSGGEPSCTHCLRANIPCVYKKTPRLPAPRTDYMAMLGKRLKQMENRVIKIIPKDASRDLSAIGRGVVKPFPVGQVPRFTAKASKKRSAAEAFDAELREWTKEKLVDHNGMVVDAVHEPGDDSRLLKEGAEHLPPADIQEHLCEVFFEYIYGQSYLLLHKPSFMRKLKAGLVPPVMTLAVCAISARFSNHPKINTEPAFLRGEKWAKIAGQIALSRHDQPNITMVTVFLILGLHEYGTCHGGRSWSYGGQALKMAYALQLHRELDYDPMAPSDPGDTSARRPLSFVDREIRRRTMWACVLQDRFVSSGGYRPPMANTEFINIQLPVIESNFQMEIPGPTENLEGEVINPIQDGEGQLTDPQENMGVSAYTIRISILWGRAIDYMNLGLKRKDLLPMWAPDSEHTQLKKQIQEFADQLPDKLKWTAENLQIHAVERISGQFIYFHMMINHTILFLNGFAIPITPVATLPKDVPQSFLAESAKVAIHAAAEISNLMSYASDHGLTAPFAGYSAFTAGIVHIWCMFSPNSQSHEAAKNNLWKTYRYLNRMKRHWGTFHYLVETTKERYRQFAHQVNNNVQPETHADVTRLEQYGAWFDRYPQGVSTSDWTNPEENWKSEKGDDAVLSHKSDLKGVDEFFADLSSLNTDDNHSSSTYARKEARQSVSATPGSGIGQHEVEKSQSQPQFRCQPQAQVLRPETTYTTSPPSNEFTSYPREHYKPGQHTKFSLPSRVHHSIETMNPQNYIPSVEITHVGPSPVSYSYHGSHGGSVGQHHNVDYSSSESAVIGETDESQLLHQHAQFTVEQQHMLNQASTTPQMQLHTQNHVTLGLDQAQTGSSFTLAGPQYDQNSQWQAPFNLEGVTILDSFFQPGGWFLPFNIPSETPHAVTSQSSAFPHPEQVHAVSPPQPLRIHEGYANGGPHNLHHTFY